MCPVVHAVPGRTRFRLPQGVDGEALRARLGVHPAVRSARWSAATRTITVEHQADTPVATVLATLPPAPEVPPDERGGGTDPRAVPERPLWREFGPPVLALGAGLIGAAPLGTAVIAGCALPVVRRALRSAQRGRVTIDTLDTAAVGLLLGTGDLIAAGLSVSLIEGGERLRRRASGRARRVLRGWMGGDARGVRIVDAGSEPRLAVENVVLGMRAVVYPGETVPVDGIVVAGTGSLDQRTWTGESMPVAVMAGKHVLAGSVVVDGRLEVSVTATGDNTRAGRLAAALEDAVAADTRVSDMARRLADRFVLPVLALGGAVFLGTRDVSRLVSLLIVDFGTGIRIAVPTSVLTTMVAGSRRQVLFRNGRAIEALAGVDTVVFDKTGTLTVGHPTVTGIKLLGDLSEVEVLRLAAAAEGHLPHPLARAIRRAARRRGLELPTPITVRYQPGGGVVAVIGAREVMVGDRRMLEAAGVVLGPRATTDSSVVLVAVDGRIAGRIRLRDRVRHDAAATIAQLRQAGIRRVWLATGDHPAAAAAVSRQLGLDGYHAAMMPEDKVALVRRLHAEGARVAVVGDGINDAAAMAEADVGVAVATGAELARDAADVVLGSEDLATLVEAVSLARGAMGLVRQNIALVAVPNAVALGLAMTGSLSPLAATAVNNGSTLLAGVNALRPLRARPARRGLAGRERGT